MGRQQRDSGEAISFHTPSTTAVPDALLAVVPSVPDSEGITRADLEQVNRRLDEIDQKLQVLFSFKHVEIMDQLRWIIEMLEGPKDAPSDCYNEPST
jgi:hypothetical protein